MKLRILATILLLLLLFCGEKTTASEGDNFDSIFSVLHNELVEANYRFEQKMADINKRIADIRDNLNNKLNAKSAKLDLLVEKQNLEEERSRILLEAQGEISKIRYKKGVQIIKLLNEKMLSLDHHFSTIKTFNEISKMSNPNSYPEFQNVKEFLKKGSEKKAFDVGSLLSSNIYTSIISTVVNLFVNNSNKETEEKNKRMEGVSCIIDFTLRMGQDLNNIFYETTFLQNSSNTISTDLETLFRDYTKPLDFKQSLKECRANDDWEKITEGLDNYLERLNAEQVKGPSLGKASKMQINLEFSIDRLLQFISLYNGFINQCTQYYGKFKVVLTNYENENKCKSQIPEEFKKLRDDIDISIQKFTTAYSTVELNGSKMKELLYGIADN